MTTEELTTTGFRLSPQQRTVWAMADGHAPATAALLRLRGRLDAAVLRDALTDLVADHEILRTTFAAVPELKLTLQRIAEEPLIDFTARPPGSADALELFAELAVRELDIENGPTVKATFLSLHEDEHVLVLAVPALCLDVAGLGILVDELVERYAARLAGGSVEVDEEALQFADLAEWMNELIEGEETVEERSFWSGFEPAAARACEPPWDVDDEEHTVRFELPDGMNVLVGELGVALPSVLFAAWSLVLGRFLGRREQMTIGTLFDGRSYDGLDQALGLLARHLPLTVEMRDSEPFVELARRVEEAMGTAYGYQEYFAWPEDEAPVFGLGFEFHPQARTVAAGGVDFALVERRGRAGACRLSLTVMGGEDGLVAEVRALAGSASAVEVDRLAAGLERLFSALQGRPEAWLHQLDVRPPGERRELLHDWHPPLDDEPTATVWELFAARSAAVPERVAIVCEEQALAYGELADRASRLAAVLVARGVEPETPVMLCVERSLDMVVGVLGILAAGGAYVALDPSAPRRRLAALCEEVGGRVWVGQKSLRRLAPSGSEMVFVELDELPAEPTTPRPATVPANLAYVLFTSGSTGRPRGVAVEGRQLVAYAQAVAKRLALGEETSFATVSTLAADLGHTAIFPTLLGGGVLHVIASSRLSDPEAMAGYMASRRVDALKIVPSHLRALLAARRPADVLPRRVLVLGGEACAWDLVAQARELAPELAIFNHYGPTETTVGVLAGAVEEGERKGTTEKTASAPLGRPLSHARLRVLDRALCPVPTWVVGELWIGGRGLARGYAGQPRRTAERYLPDPLSTEPGARLYRSGDLGRFLPDGRLEFLGRADQQIKIRGFRIEPGEVEAVLAAHPSVAAAAVVATSEDDGPRLVAAYVPRDGARLAELRAHVAEHLSDVMRPSVWVAVDALPLTPNGKLDRRAVVELAAEAPRRAVAQGAGVREPSPLEELLAGIWSDVLGVDTVVPEDDFFALGGHSLLVFQVLTRLADVLGVELPVTALFEAPSVAELAVVVEEALGTVEDAAPPIVPVPRDRPLPLSFAQERLWILDRLEPANVAYNLPMAVRLRGELDVTAFTAALSLIESRHESLRTRLVAVDGEPRQVIEPFAPRALRRIDLTDLDAARREDAARDWLLRLARQPFDLAQGPLWRTALLRLAADEHWFFLCLHHVISDGWSHRVFAAELTQAYVAFHDGEEPRLPALGAQVADFAVWQRGWLVGEVLEGQLAFWRERLADAPSLLELPTDRPRPTVPSYRGTVLRTTFADGDAAALRQLARRHGATLFMLFEAAFAVLLARFSGQPVIGLGTPIAGRKRRELEGLIGYFANTLVLLTELGDDPPFVDLLARARRQTLDAYAHQDLPFERLVTALQPERQLGASPLFQAMLTQVDTRRGTLDWPELEVTPISVDTRTAKFDVQLAFADEDGLPGALELADDLFDAATGERLIGHFKTLLQGLIADPERRVSELPLLTASERSALLEAGIGTTTPSRGEVPVTVRFEEVAARWPHRLAVVDGELQLSYGALLCRVEALAAELVSTLPPRSVVAVLAPRSTAFLVAFLAILRARCAYLPLDPKSPVERWRQALDDSGAVGVLASGALGEVVHREGLPGPRVLRRPRQSLRTRAPLEVGLSSSFEQDLSFLELPRSNSLRSVGGASGLGGPATSSDAQWALSGHALERLGSRAQTGHVPSGTSESSRGRQPIWDGQGSEPWPHPTAQDLAYVIFTSGSTGRPKGAMVEHRGLSNHLDAKIVDLELEPDDAVAQTASQSFDISVWQLLVPLVVGGRTVIYGDDVVLSPPRQLALLERDAVTVFESVPSLMQVVLDTLETSAERPSLRALRWLMLTGEALPRAVCESWLELYPGVPIVNAYGPTECSDDVAHHGLRGAEVRDLWRVPIGRSVVNTELYVLDRRGEPQPIGVFGELYVGGAGVGRGYFGDPRRTAETFVPDPFTTRPGDRLYRTGDLVRRLYGGVLDFLGRRDHQIKLRGFRIELGEIESVLEEHPAVRSAAVLVRQDPERLVAFVAPRQGASPGSEELESFLARHLPGYMVPALFVFLAELPTQASGKIDRQALKRHELPAGSVEDDAELENEARTPIVEIVGDLWAEVLGVEKVAPGDSFFELGGHSLLAIKIVAELERRLGVELPLQELFAEPTLEAVARRVEALRQGRTSGALPGIVTARQDGPAPLSFAQQRMWITAQLHAGHPAFHVTTAVYLDETIELDAWRAALEDLARRHAVLRTRFVLDGVEPVQIVEPEPRLAFELVDASTMDVDAGVEHARRFVAEEKARPFDMGGVLFRAGLLRLGEERSVAWVTLHHLITDGWSSRILVRELRELYEARRAGRRPAGRRPADRRPALAELPFQYADYALWERRVLAVHMDELFAYWRQRLAGVRPRLELPGAGPRPERVSDRGKMMSFGLEPRLVAGLEGLARQEAASLFMLLAALFATTLYRLGGERDVSFVTDVAHRNLPGTEKLIGFFTNVLALRNDLSGELSFRRLLGRVRDGVLADFAHQDMPFGELVKDLRLDQGLGSEPPFNVYFTYLRDERALAAASGEAEPIPGEGGVVERPALRDLALYLVHQPGGLVAAWHFKTDLFNTSAISRLAGAFKQLAAEVVERPDALLDDLELLSAAAKERESMEQTRRRQSSFSKFKRVKPQAVAAPETELVKTSLFAPDMPMPLVMEPALGDVDLVDWAENNRQRIERELYRHGAILFRGFDVASIGDFQRFCQAACPQLFGDYGDLPRESQAEKVYGATPYPPSKAILFHNESSHMHCFPMKQFFFSVVVAPKGGETPLVDGRRAYERLDPELRDLFEKKGLLYVRNFTEGLDVSWQEFFHTEDKAAVEKTCRESGVDFEWRGENHLRVLQRAPAVARHPVTGEMAFFNQVQLHHVSCLDPETRASMTALFDEDSLPRNVYYGDGTPIPDDVIAMISDLYWELAVSFPWREHDIVMVDNLLVSHARKPYEGPRKIVVALGELRDNVAA